MNFYDRFFLREDVNHLKTSPSGLLRLKFNFAASDFSHLSTRRVDGYNVEFFFLFNKAIEIHVVCSFKSLKRRKKLPLGE